MIKTHNHLLACQMLYQTQLTLLLVRESTDSQVNIPFLGSCKLLLIIADLSEASACSSMCRSRGGDRGSRHPPPPLENYKNIGFLSNTGAAPLKIIKLPIQHSLLGHHRPASETPFKWRFPGGLLMTR